MQFTGDDFFADKDVCSIVLEVSNFALGGKAVGLWHRTLVGADGTNGGWVGTVGMKGTTGPGAVGGLEVVGTATV